MQLAQGREARRVFLASDDHLRARRSRRRIRRRCARRTPTPASIAASVRYTRLLADGASFTITPSVGYDTSTQVDHSSAPVPTTAQSDGVALRPARQLPARASRKHRDAVGGPGLSGQRRRRGAPARSTSRRARATSSSSAARPATTSTPTSGTTTSSTSRPTRSPRSRSGRADDRARPAHRRLPARGQRHRRRRSSASPPIGFSRLEFGRRPAPAGHLPAPSSG